MEIQDGSLGRKLGGINLILFYLHPKSGRRQSYLTFDTPPPTANLSFEATSTILFLCLDQTHTIKVHS